MRLTLPDPRLAAALGVVVIGYAAVGMSAVERKNAAEAQVSAAPLVTYTAANGDRLWDFFEAEAPGRTRNDSLWRAYQNDAAARDQPIDYMAHGSTITLRDLNKDGYVGNKRADQANADATLGDVVQSQNR